MFGQDGNSQTVIHDPLNRGAGQEGPKLCLEAWKGTPKSKYSEMEVTTENQESNEK